MSTIEKILQKLQATAQDKKKNLTESYKEKSVWLTEEFDMIKKLIKQNPREEYIKKTDEPKPASVAEPTASSSSVSRESSLDGKKRKSPETVNAIKLSPQQKRASIDIEDLIAKAGLPSNLNKFTKEQLLNELKKVGCTTFTSKDLKADLVEGLKQALLSNYHAKSQESEQMSSIAESASRLEEPAPAAVPPAELSASTEMVLSTPSKPCPVRRGSQMADFRNIVTQQTAAPAVAAPAIESEFLARQNRHRESVARKSLAASGTLAVEAAEPPLLPAAPALKLLYPTDEVVAPPVVPAKVYVAAAEETVPVAAVPAESGTSSTTAAAAPTTTPRECIYPEDGVWMEVSSPARPAEEEVAEAADTAAVPAPAPAPAAAPNAVVAEQEAGEEGRTRSESDASFVSCLSAASGAPKSAAPSRETSTGPRPGSVVHAAAAQKPSVTKTVSSDALKTASTKPAVPVQSVVSKPKMTTSSIQPTSAGTSAASGNPVAAPTGSVVPSTLKRKDPIPENKSIVKTVPSAPTSTSTASAAGAPSAAAGAGAVPAKKGIFGFLTNKKPTPAGAAPTSTAASTATAPAAAAPPAMVDAIIKSARAEALAAAPAQPLQNTAAPATASAAAPTTAVKPTIPEALRVQTPPDVKEAIAQSSAARAAGGAAGGSGLKDAFSSKSLLSSIVNNYNNALKSGNNSVHGVGGSASNAVGFSAPVSAAPVVGAQTPVAPTAAPSVLRDITASATKPQQASAPAASTPAAAAPIAAAAPPTPAAPVVKEKEYIIEDRNSSDESGTDGEEDPEVARKKQESIPEWARGPQLKAALERQYGVNGQPPVDPDLIFPEVSTCSLEEIFGMRQGTSKNSKKYSARSSSAHWEPDQITLVEKRAYRKHMGYDRTPTSATAAVGGHH